MTEPWPPAEGYTVFNLYLSTYQVISLLQAVLSLSSTENRNLEVAYKEEGIHLGIMEVVRMTKTSSTLDGRVAELRLVVANLSVDEHEVGNDCSLIRLSRVVTSNAKLSPSIPDK